MELQGSAVIKVIDAETGIVEQEFTENNLVTNRTLHFFLESMSYDLVPNIFSRVKISLSTAEVPPTRRRVHLPEIIATGYVPSDVASPVVVESDTVPYGEIRNRISYVGYTRTFQTVGLTTDLESNNDWTNNGTAAKKGVDCFAALKLSQPVTQRENKIIDVYYRIQFVLSQGNKFKLDALKSFARATFGYGENIYGHPGSLRYFWAYFNWQEPPVVKYDHLCVELLPLIAQRQGNPSWSSEYIDYQNLKRVHTKSYGVNDHVGGIFNVVLQGRSQASGAGITVDARSCMAVDRIKPLKNAPFQSIFSHAPDATRPFHDRDKLATGSGKPILSGLPTNKYPDLWRITCTKAGLIGTAEYTIARRYHFGFNDNNYDDRTVANIYRNKHVAAFPGAHGWRDSDTDVLPLSLTQVVHYDATGITVLDIVNGNYINWDATTSPALEVTAIGQVAVDKANQKIYVGCRNTGLWIIDANTKAVTRATTDPCYGVDVGRENRVWAIVKGRLTNSDDWNRAFTFTLTGVTDNLDSWQNARYIKVDPNHPDDRMMILRGDRNIHWWNRATQTTVNGWQGDRGFGAPRQMDVSDVGGHWVFCYWANRQVIAKTNFGTADWLWVGDEYYDDVSHLPNGSNLQVCPHYSIQFNERGHLIARYWIGDVSSSLPKRVNTFQGSVDINIGNCFCYMGEGVGYFGTMMRQIYPNKIQTSRTANAPFIWNPMLWKEYNWDSQTSSWQQVQYTWDSATGSWNIPAVQGRLTHAGVQPMLNGVDIKFEETSTEASGFSLNNYYTQGVVHNAIWKDNSLNLYYEMAFQVGRVFTSAPVNQVISLNVGGETALNLSPWSGNENADLSFRWLETQNVSLHNLRISGYDTNIVKFYTSWTNTTLPGPNEAVINGHTGTLEFNPVDVGKTLTGTVHYLSGDDATDLRDLNSTLLFPQLTCHLRSDIGVAADVSQWNDQGAYGNHVQAAPENRPVITKAALNGLDVLTFNSTTTAYVQMGARKDILEDISRGFALFFVVKWDTSTGYRYGQLFNSGRDENNYNYKRFLIRREFHNNIHLHLNLQDTIDYDRGNWTNLHLAADVIVHDQWAVYAFIQQIDGRLIFRKNGVDFFSGYWRTIQNIKRHEFLLGGDRFRGSYAHFSCHNGHLTLLQIQRIENVLKQRYALTF